MSDFDLVDGVFSAIADKKAAHGPRSLHREERSVFFAWGALGLVENGSFQYFFENNMSAEEAAVSFDELEMPEVAECFRLAGSLLPSDYPNADWRQRRRMLERLEPTLDVLARRIVDCGKEAERRMAAYVLAHPALATLPASSKAVGGCNS